MTPIMNLIKKIYYATLSLFKSTIQIVRQDARAVLVTEMAEVREMGGVFPLGFAAPELCSVAVL